MRPRRSEEHTAWDQQRMDNIWPCMLCNKKKITMMTIYTFFTINRLGQHRWTTTTRLI